MTLLHQQTQNKLNVTLHITSKVCYIVRTIITSADCQYFQQHKSLRGLFATDEIGTNQKLVRDVISVFHSNYMPIFYIFQDIIIY